jgi:hypothetical protein
VIALVRVLIGPLEDTLHPRAERPYSRSMAWPAGTLAEVFENVRLAAPS